MESIKTTLGNPYYETKNCLIYNLDCVEVMSIINKKVIDLTITSPPYNIGKEYEKIIKVEDYIEWSRQWISLVYKITKQRGSFWLNLGYITLDKKAKAIPLTYMLWDKIPFYLIQEVVWNYGAGIAGKKFLSPRNEKWLWYVKNPEEYTFNLDQIRDKEVKYPNQKKNGKLRCNTIGKNPSDVWQIAKVTSGTNRSSKERTPHPAQFPMDLINRIVKGFSNEGDLILDPFIGSGTTAEVCLKTNRKILGFEVNKNYCEVIKERINTLLENEKIEQQQIKLFH